MSSPPTPDQINAVPASRDRRHAAWRQALIELNEVEGDAMNVAEEEEPITVTLAVKRAVIADIFQHENNLYREAQRVTPDDVNVDEHEFADFMEDCRWALERLLKDEDQQ